jgi:flagellar hook-length control protein FliK
MSSFPISPPTARAGTALSKSPGASPPTGAGDFAALLTQTTARTAHAEGPKNQTRPQDAHRDAAPRPDDDDGARTADAAPAGEAAPAPAPASTPQADASVPTPTADPKAPVAEPAPQAPAPAADPNAAAAQVVAATLPVPQNVAPAGTPSAPPTPPAPPADGRPIDPKALLLAQAQTDGQPAAGAPAVPGDGKLQIPAELLDAKGQAHAGHQGKDLNKDGAPQQDLPPAPTLPPAAAAPAASAPADAPPAAQAPAPQPASPVAQAQPTATPLTQVPTAAGVVGGAVLTRGSVVQAVEHVQELVRIATTRSGQARATLQLKPEALGQVDVHLRTTREGLVATIAAHDQAGLDALQQAGPDLRRLLEDRGVQLQSLDLQLNAGQDGGFANQGDAGQAHSGASGAASSYGLDDDEVVDEDALTITTTPQTATSALVDVTA